MNWYYIFENNVEFVKTPWAKFSSGKLISNVKTSVTLNKIQFSPSWQHTCSEIRHYGHCKCAYYHFCLGYIRLQATTLHNIPEKCVWNKGCISGGCQLCSKIPERYATVSTVWRAKCNNKAYDVWIKNSLITTSLWNKKKCCIGRGLC